MGLRTIHDYIDVSKIAGVYGGGGHAKASGCLLTEDVYQTFVNDTFHLKPLREDAKRNRYNVKESLFGSLYENQEKETFLLYPINQQKWAIEHSRSAISETFANFFEGEHFLKRQFSAWLAKDDEFVHYLMSRSKNHWAAP